MKFEFFISKRYLVKGKKNSFISIISLVSIIGITIGVAALVIALSLINGFQTDIRNKILNSSAHIIINSPFGDGFSNYTEMISQIKDEVEEITSIAPVVFGQVLLIGSGKSASGVILRGIDLKSSRNESWLKKLKIGDLPQKKYQILLGRDVAARLSLFKGEKCTAIVPVGILTPAGITPKRKSLLVSGIFKSGLYELDNGTAITSLETAQKLFKLKDNISYIQIFLKDLFTANRIAAKIKAIIPKHLRVITWQELNSSLYTALKLEKTILFFTLVLIIIVASLNIIAGLILLVYQKIKDIGILLSYGATPKIIKRIFFIQGGVIGILGTLAGVVIGLVFCALANKFELIKVPSEIYQMSYVPFNVNPLDLLLVVLASILISFTATLIPAQKAARVNVVEAIKNE